MEGVEVSTPKKRKRQGPTERFEIIDDGSNREGGGRRKSAPSPPKLNPTQEEEEEKREETNDNDEFEYDNADGNGNGHQTRNTKTTTTSTNKSSRSAKTSPDPTGWKVFCQPVDQCLRNYPRCGSIFCHILIPLWILILIAGVGGYILATFEAPNEYDVNDEILQQRFWLQNIPLNETSDVIFDLPLTCFERYLELQNDTLLSLSLSFDDNDNIFETALWDRNNEGPFFNQLSNTIFNSSTIEETMDDLRDFLMTCGQQVQSMVSKLVQRTADSVSLTATEELTFNWIRCWDRTVYGNPERFHVGTDGQISAATNQSAYYESIWSSDQQRLYEEYLAVEGLTVNGTTDPNDARAATAINLRRGEALNASVIDATGRDGCTQNTGGTAWFWFTVMTTVGYGNQAPTTLPGRAMVSTVGFLSILAFGAILASAGNIVKAIYNDLVGERGKLNLPILKRPLVGATVWGIISGLYIMFLGSQALSWWRSRLGEENFPVSFTESAWFAYISSTTVGLGDFYLQPEVMFLSDVFRFSLLFLIGFVFVSTFLNSFSDMFGGIGSGYDPESGETLEDRLRNTNLFSSSSNDGMKTKKMDPYSSKRLRMLKEMERDAAKKKQEEAAQEGGDDKQRTKYRHLAIVMTEEELLRKLLHQNKVELNEIAHHRLEEGIVGPIYGDTMTSNDNDDNGMEQHRNTTITSTRNLSEVIQEEHLLSNLLSNVVAERSYLEGRDLEFVVEDQG